MKNKLLVFFISLFLGVNSQNKIDSLSVFEFTEKLSDVWGYVDEQANEYALVGLFDGVSIVDVTNPKSPFEVYRSYGPETIWRDLKVWGDYLYVTNEADSGLLIIDLSPLPASTNLVEKYYNLNSNGLFNTAHNLFIDNLGRGYIAGADWSNKGVIILDLKTDPWNPVFLGTIDDVYVHDVFVIGDTVYTSNIEEGVFSAYDIKIVSSPALLGKQFTKGRATHNLWTSELGDFAFTTDEINGGVIGSYDVRDLSNIELLDEYKIYQGGVEMPHNVTVKGDVLFISYYKEGLVLVDASRPANLIELAKFDTDKSISGANSGGAWGVYPFLPSGNVLISDIKKGLFVVGIQKDGASYLEGRVLDASNGFPLAGVMVIIDAEIFKETSNLSGDYKTGINSNVVKSVIFKKIGYEPDTVDVSFTSNTTVIKNISLVPLEKTDASVTVQTNGSQEGFVLNLVGLGYEKVFTSDNTGTILIPNIHIGAFEFYIGKWGYNSNCFSDSISSTKNSFSIQLEQGYAEDFSVNTGWQATGNNGETVLERAMPIASYGVSGIQYDPGVDGGDSDCGSYAFCTGINPNVAPGSSTANKKNYLVSPLITKITNPEVFYKYWLAFDGRSDDTVKVGIVIGNDTIYYDEYTINSIHRSWEQGHFVVENEILNSEGFKLIFFIEDKIPWNIVDASFDNVSIQNKLSIDAIINSCSYYFQNNVVKNTCPIMIDFFVYDLKGRIVSLGKNQADFSSLTRGVYLIKTKESKMQKIIW